MFKPNYIDPVAFEIGSFSIHWYGIIIATAIFSGLIIALKECEKQDIDSESYIDLIIIMLPIAIIGARIYYVIFNWSYYSHNLSSIFAIWKGGLAIHGAIISATLTALIFTSKKGINFWTIADITAPSLILGQAIGRWGNFINQEAYGYATDLPWGIYIDGAYRHPTFLYESLWGIAIFIFLVKIKKSSKIKTGELFLIYLIAYSGGRLFIEGFRTDSLMIGPLRVAQLVSILGILISSGLIYWRRKTNNRSEKMAK
ncbi:prolipoprotein diacylglyceryl transferase [Fuchsiella alkaliacetigena]|uniref:prolipoprotein diacylglyceryl transferase n=1 Tax=Fuchsiella alkaliacetigena TaxID=957042 RepID=UPI00200B6EBF|nr:prolipoprotein diacylglyceryl transferase [Fuchsiella alkaliacetigena]MCK8824826.1 prolipoprotein diacylglyceryl transferase [Fuchsiella alkaliacetigena]